MTNLDIAAKIIELGGVEWVSGPMKRVYISQELFNELTGFGYALNESKHKFYFDSVVGGLHRRSNNKRPKLECRNSRLLLSNEA